MGRTSRAVVVLGALALVVAAGIALWLRSRRPDADAVASDGARDASGGALAPGLAGRPTPGSKPPPDAPPRGPTETSTVGVVSGDVVDEQGAPIARAVVDWPNEGQPGAVVTDAGGRFTLSVRLGHESVHLRVRAVGFAAHEEWIEPPPDEGGPSSAHVVMVKGRRVSGRVVDPDGRPVAGARVWTHASRMSPAPTKSASGETIDTARFDAVGQTVANPQGEFVLDDLPAGHATLLAEAQPFGRSYWWDAAVPSSGVEIRLRPGVVLEGTVKDREGRPVAGARVATGSGYSYYPQVDGPTDAEGRFRFPGLVAARRTIYVQATGYATASREYVRLGGPPIDFVLEPERSMEVRVTSPEDQTVPALYAADGQEVFCALERKDDVFTFTRLGVGPYTLLVHSPGFARVTLEGLRGGSPPIHVALKPADLSISGTLPINCDVHVVPAGMVLGPSRRPFLVWSQRTDKGFARGDETFEIGGLAPGRYDALIEGHDRWGTAILRGVAAGTTDLEVRMPKGEEISGTVRRPDGSPVDFVEVQAYDRDGFCCSKVDGSVWVDDWVGKFSLSGLPEGRYRLVVWLDEGSATLDDVAAPSTGVVVVVK